MDNVKKFKEITNSLGNFMKQRINHIITVSEIPIKKVTELEERGLNGYGSSGK